MNDSISIAASSSRAPEENPILGSLSTSCKADYSSSVGREDTRPSLWPRRDSAASAMHPSLTPPMSPISKTEEDDGPTDCPFCDRSDERFLRQGPVATCCTKCAGMTGTADGLRRLLDPRGYGHSTRHELDESAFAGCPVCRIILDSYVGFYSMQSCHDKIIVKGSFTNPSSARGSAEHSHPLEGMVLEGIQAYRQTKHEASSERDGKALFFEGAMVACEGKPSRACDALKLSVKPY